jgi:glyoxylase-like metal-dependent hydrolase (beta-lactamase superfamily II)
MSPEPIDLGRERRIASYLVDTDDGAALIDCGPAETVEALKTGLGEHGVRLTDIRHLLLSHTHAGHAGAAGVLVHEHPALQVHVSSNGAPNLADAIPEANVHVVGERVLGLECVPSPGHASDHVCYLDRDGTLFAGDAAGVRVGGRFVLPPTPPPEFDLDAWQATLAELEDRSPERLALTHWGVFDDVQRHLADLRLELYDWADFIRGGAGLEEFTEYVQTELRDAGEDLAMPLEPSYQGLRQWADRRPS